MLSALIGLAALLSAQQPVGTGTGLPVSVDRIRAELARPNRLRLTSLRSAADFSIEIQERERFRALVERLDFGSPSVPGGLYAFEQRRRLGQAWSSQPLVKVDVSPAGRSMMRAVSDWKRNRAEAAAHQDVKETLEQFCAVQDCAVPAAER